MGWWRRVRRWAHLSPATSHLLRAGDRYLNRLGNQLAASIAFFSVLAIVPLLMFSFAALGLTLTVIRPEWLDDVRLFIAANLNAGPLQDQVMMLIGEYLGNWRSVGLIAVIIAFFVGSSWMANVKGAIRGMIRPDFDMSERRHPIVLEPFVNLVMMLVFLVLIAVTFTLTAVGTQLAGQAVRVLEFGNVEVSRGLVRLASLGLSMGGATLLFALLYWYIPDEQAPRPALWRGSVGAAFFFIALQAGASALGNLFSLGRSTQIFGPLIVVMLFLNVFAQLILFFAAWIATWNQPAVARRHNPADEILRERENTLAVPQHWECADQDREARSRSGPDEVPEPGVPAIDPEEDEAASRAAVEAAERAAEEAEQAAAEAERVAEEARLAADAAQRRWVGRSDPGAAEPTAGDPTAADPDDH